VYVGRIISIRISNEEATEPMGPSGKVEIFMVAVINLVNRCGISVSQMIMDMVHLS
jgi:hypothetical protein